MLHMSAAQHEKWEWSTSFLNGSFWGELLHWKHLHKNKRLQNGGKTLMSKWHVTYRQTDSWHFTPQSTIKSLFISSTRLRERGKKTVCIMGLMPSTQTFVHLCMDTHTHILKAAVSEDNPRLGIPISPPPPQASGNSMFTHLHPLQRQKEGLFRIQTALHPLMNMTFGWYLHAMHDAELACQTLSFRLNKT